MVSDIIIVRASLEKSCSLNYEIGVDIWKTSLTSARCPSISRIKWSNNAKLQNDYNVKDGQKIQILEFLNILIQLKVNVLCLGKCGIVELLLQINSKQK